LDSYNYLAQGDEMCHDIEIWNIELGYDAYIQSYLYTMHFSPFSSTTVDLINLSPLEMNITPTDGDDNAVAKPEDDDDLDAGDNMPQENSMQLAAQCLKDDDEEVEACYTNNEYVEPEDPHPNKLEGDD